MDARSNVPKGEDNKAPVWLTPLDAWTKLKPIAREMRHVPTSAEDALWQLLRNNRLRGIRFRRQHAIGRFIVDFYCPAAKLILEVDGSVHATQREADEAREFELETMGFAVLRFTNEDVLEHPESVLQHIELALNQRTLRD